MEHRGAKLIEIVGVAGTGKTTLSAELNRAGLTTAHLRRTTSPIDWARGAVDLARILLDGGWSRIARLPGVRTMRWLDDLAQCRFTSQGGSGPIVLDQGGLYAAAFLEVHGGGYRVMRFLRPRLEQFVARLDVAGLPVDR